MKYRISYMVLTLLLCTTPNLAQDWVVWESNDVDSQCGVINAANLEFVVRSCDRAMVLLTGEDVGFGNTVVDEDGTVSIDGNFAGYISFEEDADGFFTVWWISENGQVMEFDDTTFTPIETDTFPSDFQNVPCAVDEIGWDAQADCNESMGDFVMQPAELIVPPSSVNCGLDSVTINILTLLMVGFISRRKLS